jgi:hypothetical protein
MSLFRDYYYYLCNFILFSLWLESDLREAILATMPKQGYEWGLRMLHTSLIHCSKRESLIHYVTLLIDMMCPRQLRKIDAESNVNTTDAQIPARSLCQAPVDQESTYYYYYYYGTSGGKAPQSLSTEAVSRDIV